MNIYIKPKIKWKTVTYTWVLTLQSVTEEYQLGKNLAALPADGVPRTKFSSCVDGAAKNICVTANCKQTSQVKDTQSTKTAITFQADTRRGVSLYPFSRTDSYLVIYGRNGINRVQHCQTPRCHEMNMSWQPSPSGTKPAAWLERVTSITDFRFCPILPASSSATVSAGMYPVQPQAVNITHAVEE